ncbi:acylphosphatase [Thermoplasmatales archaeon SM1-50]|nr:MAG: acylphosphatase [Thermoplasmatales archaeon SM1-50]
MKIQLHVVISGRVQGVWFRASTKEKADELGLTGWVKNTNDGKVEAMFEGEETKLDKMIDWCWKGPPLAKVSRVEIKQKRHGNQFTDFVVQR